MIDRLKGLWQPPYGDRRQELVLIGRHLDEDHVCHVLDEALLTDAEFHAGPSSWVNFADPLPSWKVDNTVIEYDEEAERIQRESEFSEWQEFRRE